MKAIVLTAYGGPEVLALQDLPMPTPAPGELLIKVSAVALNYANKLIREGVYKTPGVPVVMPGEIEGTVVAIGQDIAGFAPGQKVTGVANAAFAEYALLPAATAMPLPDALPTGKGLLSRACTAELLLQQAPSAASVLITAAGTGVGLYAVQLARLQGKSVIVALAGDERKKQLSLLHGATHAFTYTENWQEALPGIAGEQGIGLVLDATGGDLAASLLPFLGYQGTFLAYGNMSGQPIPVDGTLLAMRSIRVTGASIMTVPPDTQREWIRRLADDALHGRIDAPIEHFPFYQAADAFRHMEARRHQGTIVLEL
ncbi:quinone oxidoreductase family protein [Chitinophaga lutea]